MNSAMGAGRQADSDRRRQRVVKAVNTAAQKGTRITVSGIARQAGVDRTFLYRHRDLLELVHAAELEPSERDPASGAPAVSRASLQADLANAQARNVRLAARIRQLEKRLSSELGEQAWHDSGLGAPVDVEELQGAVTRLEQRNVELTEALEESQADLRAAREANRELTRSLNQRGEQKAPGPSRPR
ncbi:hypothetical protein PZ61_0236240 [Streptomyces sp. MNU77]|uniref:DUF6262 family protein n=1 Tax=Streptomyces sp. MNU77 TaxID=1573406 RepID=UPI0005E57DFC|nr:DUF6262 family protein [Streptomyces sp. MNU77]OLO25871.1 hypothetical protein PZ61_0236240 [Streptomyces sp. MNU77]